MTTTPKTNNKNNKHNATRRANPATHPSPRHQHQPNQTGDPNNPIGQSFLLYPDPSRPCGRWCRVKGGAAIAKRRAAPLTRHHRPSPQSGDQGKAARQAKARSDRRTIVTAHRHNRTAR